MTQISVSVLPTMARLAWRDPDGNSGQGLALATSIAMRLALVFEHEVAGREVWLIAEEVSVARQKNHKDPPEDLENPSDVDEDWGIIWWAGEQRGHSGRLTLEEAERVKTAHLAEGRRAVKMQIRRQ